MVAEQQQTKMKLNGRVSGGKYFVLNIGKYYLEGLNTANLNLSFVPFSEGLNEMYEIYSFSEVRD